MEFSSLPLNFLSAKWKLKCLLHKAAGRIKSSADSVWHRGTQQMAIVTSLKFCHSPKFDNIVASYSCIILSQSLHAKPLNLSLVDLPGVMTDEIKSQLHLKTT